MSTKYRCELPYFPDPGQPATPGPKQKLYLVTGGEPHLAGSYATWNSAGSHSQGKSMASVQGYRYDEREAMLSAWHASCDRGEHTHPADPALRTPPPPSTPLAQPRLLWPLTPTPERQRPTPTTRVKVKIPLHGTTPTPQRAPITISSRSPSPTATQGSSVPAVPLPGMRTYAVRSGKHGWVYSDLQDARNKFHQLQFRGRDVQLKTTSGLTQALSFAERTGLGVSSWDAERRRSWAREEDTAYHRRIAVEEAAAAAKQERTAFRQEIIEELAYYREDSEAHSSDESDGSRATDDLELELDFRVSHGHEWRAAQRAKFLRM